MFEPKINILALLIATSICKAMHAAYFRCFSVIFFDADVSPTHSDEVYSILHLHLHLEDFMFSTLLLLLSGLADMENEGLLLGSEAIVLIGATLVGDEVDMIAAYVRFVLVAQFVLILNPNQHNQKPLVQNGMKVEVHPFYYLILFVLVFSHNLNLVLLLQTDFTELPHDLYQNHLHVVIHHSQASQLLVVRLLTTLVRVLSLLSLFSVLTEFDFDLASQSALHRSVRVVA